MKKSREFIVVIFICVLLTSGCTNNDYVSFEGLNLTDSIVLYLQKQNEFLKFELDYDIYEDMCNKLFSDNIDINEKVYASYTPEGGSRMVDLTYEEFNGMKAEEIEEYIEEKGLLFNHEIKIESHQFEVSQEYEDDDLDWKYIIVRETIIGEFEAYYTYRYTFEKQGNGYSIIMVDSDKRVAFGPDDLAKMSEEEKMKWIKMGKYQTFYNEPVNFIRKFDLE